ncbi:MAG TPA: polysaccharide deacetylase family protein [Chitinophagaceae bacterium]|nr:polysaccharide deacetylase family protein [Chitinophagaceae bacterium]
MRILTFDIEDWFHILDNSSTKTPEQWEQFTPRIHEGVDRILNLLAENNLKGTFFCLGWVARKYPEIIKKIDANGYEIATHSDIHQLAYEQTRAQYKADLEQSVKCLEDVTGKKVIAYRAPGFSITEQNKWALEVLIELGIEIDCSIFPANRAHGGFASFKEATPCLIDVGGALLKEFPINLYSWLGYKFIFTGGGYFRLLPYNIIKRLSSEAKYIMTYFHPRDFDPDQPILKNLSFIRRFKSYYGLNGCLSKLNRLVKHYDFIDLRRADESIDWQKMEVIKL